MDSKFDQEREYCDYDFQQRFSKLFFWCYLVGVLTLRAEAEIADIFDQN